MNEERDIHPFMTRPLCLQGHFWLAGQRMTAEVVVVRGHVSKPSSINEELQMQRATTQSVPDPEPLLTLKQAAAYLGVSLGTMRSIRALGRLPVVRPSPGTVRVRPEDLREFIEERREGGGPFARKNRS